MRQSRQRFAFLWRFGPFVVGVYPLEDVTWLNHWLTPSARAWLNARAVCAHIVIVSSGTDSWWIYVLRKELISYWQFYQAQIKRLEDKCRVRVQRLHCIWSNDLYNYVSFNQSAARARRKTGTFITFDKRGNSQRNGKVECSFKHPLKTESRMSN